MLSLVNGLDLISTSDYSEPATPLNNGSDLARLLAVRQYEQVSQRSLLTRMRAAMRRYSGRLIDLKTAINGLKVEAQHFIGQVDVPIAAIKGSEGRTGDFDSRFHPLKAHSRERWIGVAMAWELGLALPPIELIQVGDIFFVRDGHHRISVAAAYGQTHIPANVTVWETSEAQHSPCAATISPALPVAQS